MPTLIKTLNTRIRLRYDTLANWELRNPVLLSGEMAIAAVVPEGNQTITAAVAPQILVKVGDGTSHYHDLQYISGYSADVYEWAKQAHPGDAITITTSASPTALNPGDRVVSGVAWDANNDNITVTTRPLPSADFVSAVAEGSENGKIAVTKNGTTTQVPVHGLKSAAYTESSAYATAAQGLKADSAIQGLSVGTDGDLSSALSINVNANKQASFNLYAASTAGSVGLGVNANDELYGDIRADFVDGILATTNKLLTKSKADSYYATAAQGAKADAAVRAATTSGSGLDVSIGEDALHTLTIYGSWISNIEQSPDSSVPVTSAAVKTYVDDAIAALGTAVSFVGVSTSDPASATGATYAGHTTWKKGEVVLYGNKEYINITGSNASSTTPNPNWKELGDEGSYALKTVTVTGTGYLTGGGDLTANRTIDINSVTKTKIDGAVQDVSDSTDGSITTTRSGANVLIALNIDNTGSCIGLSDTNAGLHAVLNGSYVDGAPTTSNKLLTKSAADGYYGKLSGNNTWTGINAFNGSEFSIVAANDVRIVGDGTHNLISTDNGTDVIVGDATADATHIYGGELDLNSTAITVGSATNGNINLKGATTVNGSISWGTAPSSGNHLTNKTYVDGKVSGAVNALDKSDTAVAKNVVTAVSETDGVITITRKELKATTGLTITDTSGSPTVNIDDTCVFVFNCGDSVNITE